MFFIKLPGSRHLRNRPTKPPSPLKTPLYSFRIASYWRSGNYNCYDPRWWIKIIRIVKTSNIFLRQLLHYSDVMRDAAARWKRNIDPGGAQRLRTEKVLPYPSPSSQALVIWMLLHREFVKLQHKNCLWRRNTYCDTGLHYPGHQLTSCRICRMIFVK
jgi:hypothetical protein